MVKFPLKGSKRRDGLVQKQCVKTKFKITEEIYLFHHPIRSYFTLLSA